MRVRLFAIGEVADDNDDELDVEDDKEECFGDIIWADVESELFDAGIELIITNFGFLNRPHLKQ